MNLPYSYDQAARDGFVTGLVLGVVVALLAAAVIGFSLGALGGPA
jgi:hypothetical protein